VVAVKDAVPKAVRPYVRSAYRWGRSHPALTRAAKAQLARQLTGQERHLVEAVDPVVSVNDSMAGGGWRHYFEVGLDAMRWIEAAMAAASIDAPERVLDLPCGWGRIMRFLAARYPGAELVGCDIVDDGIAFCAQQFGATPVRSSPAIGDVELPGQFDLIWCGSLATHIDAGSVEALLSLFARSLSPRGVAVVTVHGRFVEARLAVNDPFYELDPEAAAKIVREYRDGGFGYADYPSGESYETETAGHTDAHYGVSLTSREWMAGAAARAGLSEVYYGERVWDHHHDVYGLRRQS